MSISDKQLQAKIDELPKELAPERELWTGIEKAINQTSANDVESNQKQGAKVFMPTAWAASLVAAVLVTWLSLSPSGGIDANPEPSLVAAITQDFSQQKQLLLTSFGQPDTAQLPESMKAELDKLANARASIVAALEDDENNTDLLNLLQWTQQQELELIKRLYTPQWQTI